MKRAPFLQGMSGGMSKLAAALGGARQLEQGGYDAEVGTLSKMEQALAKAREDNASAAQKEQAALAARERPDRLLESIAGQYGTDVPTVRGLRDELLTGKGSIIMQGPTMYGEPLRAPMQVAPELRTNIGRALSQVMPLSGNQGDMPAGDWAKALETLQGLNTRQDLMGGKLDPQQVGRVQNAMKGEAEFQIPSNYTGNKFTGAVDMAAPINAGQQGLVGAQTGAQRANAAQSYAAADNSRASASRTRAEMNDGMGRGGKAPTGYRWGADGVTLEAIPGGPADPNTKGAKLQRPPTEGQAKAIGFGSRMAVADEVLSELEKAGTKRAGAIKGTAETVGSVLGLGTDSMGGLLSDAAGTLTNWTQSEAQQQVDQAQRDFVTAILRRESGAAIGLGEFRNAAKMYFPQPNDDEKTIRQKATARRTAINAMKAEFGEAYLPDFTRSVEEARATRQGPKKGGASGAWDEKPAGRSVTVNY